MKVSDTRMCAEQGFIFEESSPDRELSELEGRPLDSVVECQLKRFVPGLFSVMK